MFADAIKKNNAKKWIILSVILLLLISLSILGLFLIKTNNKSSNNNIILSNVKSTCLPIKSKYPTRKCTPGLIFSYLNNYQNVTLDNKSILIINTTWRKYYIRYNSSGIYGYVRLLNKIYNNKLPSKEKKYWINVIYNKRIKYINDKLKISECSNMYNTLTFLYPFIRNNNINYVKDQQLYDEFLKICNKCSINSSDYGLFYRTNNICDIYQFYKINKFCGNSIDENKIKNRVRQITPKKNIYKICKNLMLKN